MKISILGSGSGGNAAVLMNSRTAILVDAGFSGRSICDRLDRIGLKPQDISAILITHEHIDHIRGAGGFSRKYDIPVYATEMTIQNGRHNLGNLPRPEVIRAGCSVAVSGFDVHPFSIPHDAADPVGFTISDGTVKVGFCTDLGSVTHLVRQRLKGCHALVLEMNHDREMLLAGPYPWALKQRIRSRTGHLSNDDAVEFLKELWQPDLRHIILAHLSRTNNLPELAAVSAETALREIQALDFTRLTVADQSRPTEICSVEGPNCPGERR